jgi:hypothetical protein
MKIEGNKIGRPPFGRFRCAVAAGAATATLHRPKGFSELRDLTDNVSLTNEEKLESTIASLRCLFSVSQRVETNAWGIMISTYLGAVEI